MSEIIIIGILGVLIGLPLSFGLTAILLNIIAEPLGMVHIPIVVHITAITYPIILTVVFPFIFSFPFIIQYLRSSPTHLIDDGHDIQETQKKTEVTYQPNFFLLLIYRNITNKKIITLLMIIVISTSIGVFTGIRLSIDSVVDDNTEYYNEYPADIIIDSDNFMNRTATEQFLINFFITNFPNDLKDFTPLIWQSIEYEIPNYVTKTLFSHILVLGMPQYASELHFIKLVNDENVPTIGDNISEILISQQFVDTLTIPFNTGSQLTLMDSNTSQSFIIKGIVNPLFDLGWQLFAPLDVIASIIGKEGQINRIQIRLQDESKLSQIASLLQKQSFISTSNAIVRSSKDYIERANRPLEFYEISGNIVSWIGITACVIGTINILVVNAIDKRKEIAVLKLLGAKAKWIVGIYFCEFLIITFISSIIGLILAKYYVAVRLLFIARYQYKIVPVALSFKHILFSLELGVIISFLSSIFPGYLTVEETRNSDRIEAL